MQRNLALAGHRYLTRTYKGQKEKVIMGIVKCTHREDSFLPPPEKIEEMRKAFEAEGFVEEPGWFFARNDWSVDEECKENKVEYWGLQFSSMLIKAHPGSALEIWMQLEDVSSIDIL